MVIVYILAGCVVILAIVALRQARRIRRLAHGVREAGEVFCYLAVRYGHVTEALAWVRSHPLESLAGADDRQ